MQETHRLKAPLLCCICHDHNSSLRYEVVYRQADKSITILDISASKEELQALTGDSVDSETEYYNFPAKHPRHGHLRWTSTYPDYPVHIPTFTLSRINNLLASRAAQGNDNLNEGVVPPSILTGDRVTLLLVIHSNVDVRMRYEDMMGGPLAVLSCLMTDRGKDANYISCLRLEPTLSSLK